MHKCARSGYGRSQAGREASGPGDGASKPQTLQTSVCTLTVAKRRARGFTRFTTIRTVIFLIAGKLDFAVINPHARQPT